MNIIKHKSIFLVIAAIVVVASIVGIGMFGLKQGIDFTGGSLWQVQFEDTAINQEAVTKFFKENLGATEVVVAHQSAPGSFSIKLKELNETTHQEYAGKMRGELGFFAEESFQSIGASIGKELTGRAIWAFIINLLAITLYVAYAFRKVSLPVSSWKYATVTLITLFHDAILPIGVFAFLGHFLGVEIDTNFIVAILVVVGFSVHDTIVVFDRIREHVRKSNVKIEQFGGLVNESINQTIARSINTSLTLIIVLVALYFLGAASLAYFILAILIGTIAGTYSSIFVASPLLVSWASKRG